MLDLFCVISFMKRLMEDGWDIETLNKFGQL